MCNKPFANIFDKLISLNETLYDSVTYHRRYGNSRSGEELEMEEIKQRWETCKNVLLASPDSEVDENDMNCILYPSTIPDTIFRELCIEEVIASKIPTAIQVNSSNTNYERGDTYFTEFITFSFPDPIQDIIDLFVYIYICRKYTGGENDDFYISRRHRYWYQHRQYREKHRWLCNIRIVNIAKELGAFSYFFPEIWDIVIEKYKTLEDTKFGEIVKVFNGKRYYDDDLPEDVVSKSGSTIIDLNNVQHNNVMSMVIKFLDTVIDVCEEIIKVHGKTLKDVVRDTAANVEICGGTLDDLLMSLQKYMYYDHDGGYFIKCLYIPGKSSTPIAPTLQDNVDIIVLPDDQEMTEWLLKAPILINGSIMRSPENNSIERVRHGMYHVYNGEVIRNADTEVDNVNVREEDTEPVVVRDNSDLNTARADSNVIRLTPIVVDETSVNPDLDANRIRNANDTDDNDVIHIHVVR